MNRNCDNSEYDSRKKGIGGIQCIVRINDPVKATALVFKSGEMVIQGTKSEYQLHEAVEKFAKLITAALGYPEEDPGCKEARKGNTIITSIKATLDVGHKVKLSEIPKELNNCHSIDYKPEVWCGFKLRMSDPELGLTIFSSGKINFYGAKREEDIYQAF